MNALKKCFHSISLVLDLGRGEDKDPGKRAGSASPGLSCFQFVDGMAKANGVNGYRYITYWAYWEEPHDKAALSHDLAVGNNGYAILRA